MGPQLEADYRFVKKVLWVAMTAVVAKTAPHQRTVDHPPILPRAAPNPVAAARDEKSNHHLGGFLKNMVTSRLLELSNKVSCIIRMMDVGWFWEDIRLSYNKTDATRG